VEGPSTAEQPEGERHDADEHERRQEAHTEGQDRPHRRSMGPPGEVGSSAGASAVTRAA
jgi:hypothetical protein